MEPDKYEVDDVSAARKRGAVTQFRVHWVGGVERWGDAATSWEPLERQIVLAAWEKHSEREHVTEASTCKCKCYCSLKLIGTASYTATIGE